jgi:hypothetical protein
MFPSLMPLESRKKHLARLDPGEPVRDRPISSVHGRDRSLRRSGARMTCKHLGATSAPECPAGSSKKRNPGWGCTRVNGAATDDQPQNRSSAPVTTLWVTGGRTGPLRMSRTAGPDTRVRPDRGALSPGWPRQVSATAPSVRARWRLLGHTVRRGRQPQAPVRTRTSRSRRCEHDCGYGRHTARHSAPAPR